MLPVWNLSIGNIASRRCRKAHSGPEARFKVSALSKVNPFNRKERKGRKESPVRKLPRERGP